MDIQTFLSFAIVGAMLTTVIGWIKTKYGVEGNATKMLTVGSALLVGAIFWGVASTSYMESFIGVLTASSTVYAFLRK